MSRIGKLPVTVPSGVEITFLPVFVVGGNVGTACRAKAGTGCTAIGARIRLSIPATRDREGEGDCDNYHQC